jgi:radical SAM protein with 4Fe4S-binding SPASM domain
MKLLGAIFQDPRDLGLKQGTYRHDGKGDLKGHRFHLRVDSESKGVLMIDASKLVFLNGSALDYVRCYLEGRSDRDAAKYMRTRYKGLKKATLEKHYERVKSQFREYLRGDVNVIKTMGTESQTIGFDKVPAPYRMDLALTYRCQNDCGHCYNETKDKMELTPEQWMTVIDKLWEVGVPHIVFTGGEPTLYEGLDKLVAQTEEHGQVTGLITNGRSLGTPGYLKELVKLGLDHVQITVLSHKEIAHDRLAGSKGAWKETIEGLKVALSEDLYVSTNTTIMRSNSGDIEDTLRFLEGLGVKNIAFNSIIRAGKGEDAEGITYEELTDLLVKLREIAKENDINLIWYTPTPYHEFNPVNYGFGIKQCTACSMNMAVEPDGTVLPCQSYYKSLGNILTDPWPSIWNHELCKKIRERGYLDGDCVECDLKQVCGGGCPLSREHGDYVCLDRNSSM